MTAPQLENVEDVYPLSPIQEGMLFHTVSDDVPGAFVDQISVELLKPVEPERLRAAWAQLVARHTALRTVFLWDGLDQPLQIVKEEVTPHFRVETWPDIAPARLTEWLRHDRATGFDLATAPASRVALLTSPDQTRLVWTYHHLLSDGWSAQILLNELAALYAAAEASTQPVLQAAPKFRDFIAWQRSTDVDDDERFWRRELAGFSMPHRLEIPGYPAVRSSAGHRTATVALSPHISAALLGFPTRLGVTLNTVVLGAWALLLARWVRAPDVVFGTTRSTRPAEIPGAERLVGPLINTLPTRVTVDETMMLGDWLRTIQSRQMKQQPYERTALAAVQRWSEIPRGEPLFESLFVFENYPPRKDEAASALQFGKTDYFEHSNYPLAVLTVPQEMLSTTFVYDSARLSDDAIDAVARAFKTILEGFANGGDRPVAEIPWADPTEVQQSQSDLRGAALAPAVAPTFVERFSAHATEQPDRVAVDAPQGLLTYGALHDRSSALARQLTAAGVGRGEPVGLCVERSADLIVGIVGIMKAGAAYVPLDPTYPRAHLERITSADRIDRVVSTSTRADLFGEGTSVVRLDAIEPPDLPVASGAADAHPTLTHDDAAYVIYTSGSTGRPKGVLVSHGNLARSTAARSQYYGRTPDRFLLLSSFAFDSSVAGIFWSLFTGGTLVLPPPGLEHDVAALASLIEEKRVTDLLCLPALYEALLENADGGRLDSLVSAIVAGEACPSSTPPAHRAALPTASLYNEYGPTEATVWCTVHRLDTDHRPGPPPIGGPIPGVQLELRDQRDRPAPRGFAAELHIAGPTVAQGYLHQPDRTAERFSTSPDPTADGQSVRSYRTGDLACLLADGTIRFLGRADHQVKVRGHRIETAAVEAALREMPVVHEAAVRTIASPSLRSHRLAAYVVPTPNSTTIESAAVRAFVATRLPGFMVPDVVLPLERLPRLPNGKVDIAALPIPDDDSGLAYEAPRGSAEEKLAEIWSTLLGVDRISRHDDYFALGGDSIISIQMISRARRAGLHLQPRDVAKYSTLAALASAAAEGAPRAGRRTLGEVPLSAIQQWFFDLAPPSVHHWNQSRLFALPAGTEPAVVEAALKAIVEHHDLLRARYFKQGGAWNQTVADDAMTPLVDVLPTDDGPPGDDRVSEAFARAQAGLRLESGGLFRGLLIRASNGTPDRLLIVAHHLVVDAVSWSILAEDLQVGLDHASRGQPIAFAPRTTPVAEYVHQLRARDRAGELDFWRAQPVHPLPLDGIRGRRGTEGAVRTISVALDTERSTLLMSTANSAYQTRAEELLVAGLGWAIARWADAPHVTIALERHGRDAAIDGVDLTRTVGWLSAVYPVTLAFTAGGDPARAVKATKERLRQVPEAGIGYGILKYLDRQPDLVAQRDPDLLFNYLGRTAGPVEHAEAAPRAVRPIPGADPTSRAPDSPLGYPLEVIAVVRDGRMRFDWRYEPSLSSASIVQRLTEGCITALERLIDHCAGTESGGLTPSDAPGTGLDQDELDSFLDEISS